MKKLKYIFSVIFVLVSGIYLININSYAQNNDNSKPDEEKKIIEKSYFVKGKNILIDKQILGDLFILGGDINIDNLVDENLFVIGNTIQINKKVDDSVFLIGKKININAEIDSDLFAIANNLQISEKIDEDAYILADKVLIQDDIDEELYIKATTVYIDGDDIKDKVYIKAKSVQINPETDFSNNVYINGKKYKPEELKPFYNEELPVDLSLARELNPLQKFKNILNIYGILLIFAFLIGNSIASIFIQKIFPVTSEKIIHNLNLDIKVILQNLKLGAIGIFGGAFFAIVLSISIIGWPILILLISCTILALLITKNLAIYKIGEIIIKLVQPNIKNNFIKAIVGSIVFTLVFMILFTIPIIGNFLLSIFLIILIFWSLGALIQIKYKALRKSCKKKT